MNRVNPLPMRARASRDILGGLAPFFLAPVPVPCGSAQRDRHRRRSRSQSHPLVHEVERNEPSITRVNPFGPFSAPPMREGTRASLYLSRTLLHV